MGKYIRRNGNGTALPNELGMGSPSSSNYLRGDGLWSSVGGGGAHTHPQSDVEGLLADLILKVNDDDARLSDARTPLAHSHPQSDITNLTTDLAGKASLSHTHSLSDITDKGALASKNSIATGDIDADAVTFPKIQNIATNKLLGRGSASAGDIEEITLGTNLTLAGTTLNASGGGGGGLTLTTVEVNLGSEARRSGRFTISGTGLTAGKPLSIQQAVGPYTGKGSRSDEVEMDLISVAAKVLNGTTIECFWQSRFRIKGNIKFDYAVSS